MASARPPRRRATQLVQGSLLTHPSAPAAVQQHCAGQQGAEGGAGPAAAAGERRQGPAAPGGGLRLCPGVSVGRRRHMLRSRGELWRRRANQQCRIGLLCGAACDPPPSLQPRSCMQPASRSCAIARPHLLCVPSLGCSDMLLAQRKIDETKQALAIAYQTAMHIEDKGPRVGFLFSFTLICFAAHRGDNSGRGRSMQSGAPASEPREWLGAACPPLDSDSVVRRGAATQRCHQGWQGQSRHARVRAPTPFPSPPPACLPACRCAP